MLRDKTIPEKLFFPRRSIACTSIYCISSKYRQVRGGSIVMNIQSRYGSNLLASLFFRASWMTMAVKSLIKKNKRRFQEVAILNFSLPIHHLPYIPSIPTFPFQYLRPASWFISLQPPNKLNLKRFNFLVKGYIYASNHEPQLSYLPRPAKEWFWEGEFAR